MDLDRSGSLPTGRSARISGRFVLTLALVLLNFRACVLLLSLASTACRKLLQLPLDVVVWRHVQRAKRNIHVVIGADHRLILRLIDALQGPDDLEIEIVPLLALLFPIRLIFLADDLADGGMVLLVALVDVGDQRALTWQEGAADLESLPMPVLALRLHLNRVDVGIVPHVDQESQFGRHAEVRDREEADLLYDRVPSELDLDAGGRVQVVDGQRGDLHDVPDVEQVHPLALIQVSEEDAHIYRVRERLVVGLRLELLLLLYDPVGLVRVGLPLLLLFLLLLSLLPERLEVAVKRLASLRIGFCQREGLRLILFVPCHPLCYFLNDWVVLKRCSLKHADLLIEVNEIRFV